MIVLNQQQMQELDTNTMSFLKRTSLILMEVAGKVCADKIISIRELMNNKNPIIIFCGNGNNGGDGFVIARWLKQNNINTKVILLGNVSKFSESTKNNYKACLALNIEITQLDSIEQAFDFHINNNVCIDAVFGNGFSGALPALHSTLFAKINDESSLTISIDLPSGLSADTGSADLNAIRADYTLCIAFYKYGHLINRGKELCGKIEIVDICIPNNLLSEEYSKVKLVNREDISYPNRFKTSHKGDYGKVAIFAGSEQFTGAAVLSANACLNAGAGLIYLFSSSAMRNRYDASLIEVIKVTIPEKDHLPDSISLEKMLQSMDCILIGPGIGTEEYSLELVKTVLKQAKMKPVILDADALNIISKNRELLEDMKGKNVLLTPHIAEFARLSNHNQADIQENQIVYLKEFVTKYQVTVLLKSSVSLCSNNEDISIIANGNDGLSTGGSGDVLAGIIASFVAQNMRTNSNLKEVLYHAAVSGSYLLGETADSLNEIYETAAITPQRIINNIFKNKGDKND